MGWSAIEEEEEKMAEIDTLHGPGRLLNGPHYYMNPQAYGHNLSFSDKHNAGAYN
jgi:hypothetical protein